MRIVRKILLTASALTLLISCSSYKGTKVFKTVNNHFKTNFQQNFFSGVLVYNPKTKDTIYSRNAKKYFTPASNTKIFTLYAGLKLLPKYIPAIKYIIKNDSLFIEGTGDPSFLHHYFKDSTALHFLKQNKNIVLHLNNYEEDKFGSGWAWEDYDLSFSPEITSMPIYGNVASIHIDSNLVVSPNYLKDSINQLKTSKRRALTKNTFYFDPTRKDTLEIPFITRDLLIKNLLEDALHQKITLSDQMPKEEKSVLYGIPFDSLYQRMLYESDNFIAEQLLLLASSTLSDTLNSSKVRNHVLDTYLSDLKQTPRWVDGSGLSRYNLFSPASMVTVLEKMYREFPRKRLFNLFPAGGVSGTMKEEFAGDSTPYIYAKSGSLSNNYCLSGYLITKKGETLIFSYMNNHFRRPTSEVKEQMEIILQTFRDNY